MLKMAYLLGLRHNEKIEENQFLDSPHLYQFLKIDA